MMHLDPKNTIIYNQILAIKEQNSGVLSGQEYNQSRYQIMKQANEEKILFSFGCYNFNNLFKIAGKEMLEQYYPELGVEKTEEGYNVTVSIDLNSFNAIPSKEELKKGGYEKEEVKAWKRENKERIEKYANALSNFRRNFYAAPMEKAFKSVKEGKPAQKMSIQTRQDEQMWIIPEKESVNVYIGIGFEGKIDSAIARLILNEMEESKRQVQNAPSVIRFDKVPDTLLKEFPDVASLDPKIYKNGFILFTLRQDHLVNYYDKASFIQGFRQYLHYHIQASKTYLHGRIRKTISNLHRAIILAKIDDEEPKIIRSDKGDNIIEEQLQEERNKTILRI